ncbi:Hypothetical predicted protein [Mytilus galloprovincialis]|uniref:Integrase catalytic domain-containing protein n=1 Tax=Mytilus galloprovincialis TaxID=29158 RepID=A0A8B6HNN4_MYTGA|nr:Hypothetical predicted protein [Mytilus galloprovincialis]
MGTHLTVACCGGNYQIFQLLTDKGCDATQASGIEETYLTAACCGENYKIVQLLKEKRCDLEHVSAMAKTLLRFAFGGHLKQKTAKEVSELLLRFIYIFGSPRILQTDNGKTFNYANLCAVIDELKTRKINGRPYHPQSQVLGRVERFNRTVVAYFIAQFVDTRDCPSLLGEFHYKYNNRVNKATRPMTPHQRFYKRPNFSMALEEQINSKSVIYKASENKAREIARMDLENDYQEFVESMWHSKITNRIKESEVVISANETITSNKHAMAPVNGVDHFENREKWDSSMYPEELFPKKVSKLTEMHTFHPSVNEVIDFKPISALSASTNVFLSGYWKKGLVINIENNDSKGNVYTIKELENGKIHQISKYLIRPNLI